MIISSTELYSLIEKTPISCYNIIINLLIEDQYVKELFMGGIDGSRGYVYQGIAAVIESLTNTSWDKIYIEFITKDDKVDIALSENDKITQAIQVKSTSGIFNLPDVKKWIKDINNDFKCENYEIFIVGQCSGGVQDFKKAIDKYKNQQLDKSATQALKGFDTTILDEASVRIRILPFDFEIIQSQVLTFLSKYLTNECPPLNHNQLEFIAKAMLSDQLIKSTNGSFTARSDFESDLHNMINLLKKEYCATRIPIAIKSFDRWTDHLNEFSDNVLDLSTFFEENKRELRPLYDWNRDLLPCIEDFFSSKIDTKLAYKIYLETHSSISFAAGRQCNTKSGINSFPIQKTFSGETQLWTTDNSDNNEYQDWLFTDTRISHEYNETALIINLSRKIDEDVLSYISEQNIPVGRVISCNFENKKPNNFSVQNGTHANMLANNILNALAMRNTFERRSTLHIFAATNSDGEKRKKPVSG